MIVSSQTTPRSATNTLQAVCICQSSPLSVQWLCVISGLASIVKCEINYWRQRGEFLVQYHTTITNHINRFNGITADMQCQVHSLALPQVGNSSSLLLGFSCSRLVAHHLYCFNVASPSLYWPMEVSSNVNAQSSNGVIVSFICSYLSCYKYRDNNK